MKRQLIAIGLASFLAVPSVVFAQGDDCSPVMAEGMAEEDMAAAKEEAMNSPRCMGQRLATIEDSSHGHGVSLYGSFRGGLKFGSGDTAVNNYGSRWGLQGSFEAAEGLTAGFKFETNLNIKNAESAGGVGHTHGARQGTSALFSQEFHDGNSYAPLGEDGMPLMVDGAGVEPRVHTTYAPHLHTLEADDDGNVMTHEYGGATFATGTTTDENDAEVILHFRVNNRLVSRATGARTAIDADGGPGGRLSNVSLSGGFGSITLGRIWSASYNHYGAALDPTWFNGSAGGAAGINSNSISYRSSAGDVSFQIDKVTGDYERLEFGATADLGPIGVGLGYWNSKNDGKSFTGVALSTGAGGIGLAVGLGSVDNGDGMEDTDASLISLSGAVGDTGVSYGVQVANSDDDSADQTLVSLVNILGPGAAIHFEHLDPGEEESSSHLVLKIDF